jgi:hypothetical protein
VVLFLHIPKAAGQTLSQVIVRHFDPATVFAIGRPNSQFIEKVKGLSDSEQAKIRLIKGHMPFGLHEYLLRPSTYITMLREPVDRAISYYYFALHTPDHYLHETLQSKRMSLREFVLNGLPTELDNGQTRLLSGIGNSVGVGECDLETLERAKQNLVSHFAVVGFAERFDETLLLLRSVFGWRNLYYARLNVTRNRPSKDAVDQETLEAIMRSNELDRHLYEWARERFEQELRRLGAPFQRELAAFRWQNAVYGRLLGYKLRLAASGLPVKR